MKILIISPDIEHKARGINMILNSIVSSAKKEKHEIGLLIGLPFKKYKHLTGSQEIISKLNHIDLEEYISGTKKCFNQEKKKKYGRRIANKTIFSLLKAFNFSKMILDHHLLSNKSSFLKNIDYVIRANDIYRLVNSDNKFLINLVVKRILKKFKFDIIISITPSLLNKKTVSNAKLIHFVHDVIPLELLEVPSGNNRIKFARKFISTCYQSDILLTNSKDTQKKILAVNSNANIQILYGTNSCHLNSILPSSIIVSRQLLPKKFLLFVSTLEKRKNINTLIDAFVLVAHEIDMPLVIVGHKGFGYEEIEKKYNSIHQTIRKRIIFMDYINENDKYELYKHAFALVFPSLYEGLGLVIIESMSCGLPVITSRRGALMEAGGDAAFYIDNPLDCLEIANAIKKLVNVPKLKNEMIQKGFKQAEKFTFKQFEKRFKNALEKLY